ncbi:response regulator transcription factor [Sphingosinicella sp. CPCC 101087]|uniref:response regulator transcription factor n=1 Tax=Sphingosinicella sp. CPCC 101087 TaxID=2497754 RepID=UPI00101B9B43|nr:response regulator [Sphingosinicella sp. CPCC 101087]
MLAASSRARCLSNPPLIAIVDDDQAVREALYDLLQVEGLTARTFDSAAAFITAWRSREFDCLITDVRMPGMDGMALQQHLRASGSAMPVIFLTSSTNEATRTRAMLEGASAWFSKPAADDALLNAVKCVLDPQGRNLPEA